MRRSLIDGEYRRHQRKSAGSPPGLFAHQLKGSAVATSQLSAAYKASFDPFGDDKVAVPGDAYTIANADTNRP